MEKFGLTATKFRRELDQLTDCGFIEVAASGLGICQTPTKFNVLVGGADTDEKWRKFGEPGFRIKKRVRRNVHKFPTGKANPRYSTRPKKDRGAA